MSDLDDNEVRSLTIHEHYQLYVVLAPLLINDSIKIVIIGREREREKKGKEGQCVFCLFIKIGKLKQSRVVKNIHNKEEFLYFSPIVSYPLDKIDQF